MSSERVLQKDLYGFPISVTKEEQAERVRCFKKSKKRQARDWAFETAHRHIPASVSHEDMKRRCRKVSVGFVMIVYLVQVHSERGGTVVKVLTGTDCTGHSHGTALFCLDGNIRCLTEESTVCIVVLCFNGNGPN